jgi:hypothetical protein
MAFGLLGIGYGFLMPKDTQEVEQILAAESPWWSRCGRSTW